ncbi:MAG: hypothetical protein WCI36_05455 [bacterium]
MKEKIASSFLFIKGFIKMSTMIILLILLVTYYFYQDKIKEISRQAYNDNKESGTLFYVTGIWNNMVEVQKKQEARNQNSFDLAGSIKILKDKSNLYSIEIPENWNVTTNEANIGKQISKIIASNKVFSQHNIGSDIFYDNGAQLTIQVLAGELAIAKNPDGAHGKMLIDKKTIPIDGENATYHIIADKNVKLGKIIDVHILRGEKPLRLIMSTMRKNSMRGNLCLVNL